MRKNVSVSESWAAEQLYATAPDDSMGNAGLQPVVGFRAPLSMFVFGLMLLYSNFKISKIAFTLTPA